MSASTLMLDQMHRVCTQHSVPFEELDWEQNVGVSANLFLGQQPINGLRHHQEDGTLGWYLYASEDFPTEDNAFRPVCAKHLFERELSYLKFLALPPGWRFLTDDKGYEDVWFDESLLEKHT